MTNLIRYLLCLLVAVGCLYLCTYAAVESPDRFGYASAAFVACVMGIGFAAASMILAW